MHVAITPRKTNWHKECQTAEVPEIVFQGLEDARIHGKMGRDPVMSRLMKMGPLLKSKKAEGDAVSSTMKRLSVMMDTRQTQYVAAGLFLGAYGTPEEKPYTEVASLCGLNVEALAEIGASLDTFEDVRSAARKVHDLVEPMPAMEMPGGTPEPKPGGRAGPTVMDSKPKPEDLARPPIQPNEVPKLEEMMPQPKVEEEEKPKGEDEKTVEYLAEQSSIAGVTEDFPIKSQKMPGKPSPARVRVDGGKPKPTETDEGWGRMRVADRTLLASRKRKRRDERKHWRQSDHGGSVAQLHRIHTDQKVFRRKKIVKRRENVGSLLVDFSGSMSIDPRVLTQIVEESPAATIAIYSGNESTGLLTIVAIDGRQVDDFASEVYGHRRRSRGGNIVDGPALAWLATQPEPRIWVSDGFVTGKYENQTVRLYRDAERLRAEGRIFRVPQLDQVAGEEGEAWLDCLKANKNLSY